MVSLLVLALWMVSGAICAAFLSPAGSWPMAMILGPLWFPVAVDAKAQLQSAPVSATNAAGLTHVIDLTDGATARLQPA